MKQKFLHNATPVGQFKNYMNLFFTVLNNNSNPLIILVVIPIPETEVTPIQAVMLMPETEMLGIMIIIPETEMAIIIATKE